MNIADLDTPTLVADLDVLERNIDGMAALCRQLGIPLRVHSKTHKVPEIAKLQIAAVPRHHLSEVGRSRGDGGCRNRQHPDPV